MSNQSPSNGRSGGGGRTLTLVVVALVAALVGAGAAHFASFHHGWHHGGPFGHRHGHGWHHGEMNATDVQRHVDRMVEHIARHTNATADQKTKLAAIAKAAATDLLPLHQQLFEAHKKAIALMRQPTIDRAAIEALRVEQIARADAASKRLVQALADAAEVLTPEQRAQFLDRFDHDDD